MAVMLNFALFPFWPNYPIALVMFTVLGTINGNAAVTRALVADATTACKR